MRTASLLVLVPLVACGGSPKVPPARMGAYEHLTEAERHEREAREHDEQAAAAEARGGAAAPICGDRALADQNTSGTERLDLAAPCWTSEAAAVERHHQAAERLRADARVHRAMARQMATEEREACAGLSEAEIEHSPFEHREDIAGVMAELDGDHLRGARVRFARVPGLSAAWMRRALACHQARASAYGNDPGYLPDNPAVVAGASTTVLEDEAGLTVVMRAEDPAAALVIYARAEALIEPRRAE